MSLVNAPTQIQKTGSSASASSTVGLGSNIAVAAGHSGEAKIGLAATLRTFIVNSPDPPGIPTPSPTETSPLSSVGSSRFTDNRGPPKSPTQSAPHNAETHAMVYSISEHTRGLSATQLEGTSEILQKKTRSLHEQSTPIPKVRHQLSPSQLQQSALRAPIHISVPATPPAASKGFLWWCWGKPDVSTPVIRLNTNFDEEPVLLAISMSRRGGGVVPDKFRVMIQEVRPCYPLLLNSQWLQYMCSPSWDPEARSSKEDANSNNSPNMWYKHIVLHTSLYPHTTYIIIHYLPTCSLYQCGQCVIFQICEGFQQPLLQLSTMWILRKALHRKI